MNKLFFALAVLGLVGVGVVASGGVAHAMTPTLSLSAAGGDSVQVTVYGDSYATVTLYYQSSGYGTQSRSIGSTNSNGYLSTTVSSSSLGVTSGGTSYVMVNGQTSSAVSWPYYSSNCGYSSCSGGSVSLSQTSMNLNSGQSATVTIYGGSQPYAMYTGDNSILRGAIGGNTLTVWGQGVGSGTLSVCSSGVSQGGSGCATLNITVGSGFNYNYNYGYGALTLSQSSVAINTGQSASVTVSGGSGNYYVSSNSNASIVAASINGSTVGLYGNNPGTSTITICQGGGGQCGSIYVTVGSGNYNYNYNYNVPVGITFSPSVVYVNTGQSASVTVSGGSGSGYYGGGYYIAYNSNSNVISANISGSTLNVGGSANATGVIVVCSSSTMCGAVSVVVGNVGSYYGYNPSSGNWSYCSEENQTCYISGTRQVRYGANGAYYYRTMSGSIYCSNGTFGDPIPNVRKQCYVN